MRAEFMPKEQNHTYEKLYYTLWELAGRYSGFCQFRAVGNSHDDRLIPMLEVGNGAQMIFCVAGIDGTQNLLPRLLIQMAEEYCRAYECGWQLEEFYEVKKLLDKIRICFLPLLNPDGYEISQSGFSMIRNPIYRQMLRMQSIPAKDFGYNARGVDICHNFPTVHYIRSRMGEEPASENENEGTDPDHAGIRRQRASHFRTGRQGNRVLSQRTGDGRSAKVVPSCQTYAEILVLSSGTGTRLTVFREEIQRDGNPGTILYSDNKTASLSHQGSRTRERWKSWRRKPNENL